ncbi:hypothetical protein ACHAQH_009276 [Verticillium albo-atrum]
MPAGSQSSRSTKRFKSAGPDVSPTAPIAPLTAPDRRRIAFSGLSPKERATSRQSTASRVQPGETASIPLLAPVALMDSPTAGLESPVVEDVTVTIEQTVAPRTPGSSLLGAIGSKIDGAIKGQKGLLGSARRNRAPAAGRKRLIDEVEDAMTVRHVAETVVAENGEPAGQENGNDMAMELNDQLKDTTQAADVQAEEGGLSSPTPKGRSVSLGNSAEEAPAKASTTAKQRLTTAQKAIQKAEAKSSALPRRRRARTSDVAGAAPGSKTAAAKADSTDTSNNLSEFEIDKIVDHRHNADDPTLLDVRVSWESDDAAGDFTWEPESNMQEDAPAVLFRYWRTVKGGRSSVLEDPDMWHVLRIEKHQVVQGTDEVVLHVAWIGSAQRSWELEEAVAGYAKEHLDEYWAKLGGREFVLSTAAPATALKRRGRPPRVATAKAAAAKHDFKKAAAAKPTVAKAPAKKAATAAGTKRQPTQAPATSARSTRSSRR